MGKPKKRLKSGWEAFGWQGISLDVPAQWSFAVVSGDRKKGYAALDDEETVCLELRWEALKRRADCPGLFRRFLKKRAKSLRLPVSALNASELGLPAELSDRVHAVQWVEGDAPQVLAVVEDPPSGRLALLQARVARSWAPRGFLLKLLNRFSLGGPAGDLWAFYGMSLRLPESFGLFRSAFKSGLIDLEWRDKAEKISVRRLALGAMTLAERDVGRWAEEFLGKRFGQYQWEKSEGECCGHEAVELAGRPRSLWMKTFSRPLAVRAWLCAQTDRLFHVVLEGRRAGPTRMAELISTLSCHGGDCDVAPEEKARPGREPAGAPGGQRGN